MTDIEKQIEKLRSELEDDCDIHAYVKKNLELAFI